MRVKEVDTEQFLEDKYKELQDLRATLSEFETRMTEVINNNSLGTDSKLLMIKSAYQRTIGFNNE